MQSNVMIFSIAVNGYQWLYRDCIASHKLYAKRHGYHYQVITRPYVTALGVECCWLKLSLMLEALKAGYDTVMFVDADAYIKVTAPKLGSVFRPLKYLYLAKSYTGRYNSGVILVRNSKQVRQWITEVLSQRHIIVKYENDVGWGENGHIIQHTRDCQFVSTLSSCWNNTYDPNLDDYIRHFSFGPLRQNIWLNLSHKLLSRLTRLLFKLRQVAVTLKLFDLEQDLLAELTQTVLKHYSDFCRTPQ